MRSSEPKRRSEREACRSRSRLVSRTASSAVLLLVAAACGGGESSAEPALPRDVGARLAAQTDAVADALAAGDACTAKERAEKLRRTAGAAIDAGRIDPALRRELRRASRELVARISCAPPPSPPPPPEPTPAPQPPPPDEEEEAPPAEACADLEEELDALEEQLEGLEKDDPLRQALEGELDALEEELKACEKEAERGGGGEKGEK